MNIHHQQMQQNLPPALAGGARDEELDEFVTTLKTQVEIFVNRMKSNSSRGRSITNDSSVQTLFMNTMAMHSKLLKHIQDQEDKRVYYEGLQDKLAQVKDARAALDALREEERERKRREAEEAERLRQIQMREKLEVMRKKKQEYLQYQRQLALQRMQEQEREMKLRQEQVKQQYAMNMQQQAVGYQPNLYGQTPMPPQAGMYPGMIPPHPGMMPSQQQGSYIQYPGMVPTPGQQQIPFQPGQSIPSQQPPSLPQGQVPLGQQPNPAVSAPGIPPPPATTAPSGINVPTPAETQQHPGGVNLQGVNPNMHGSFNMQAMAASLPPGMPSLYNPHQQVMKLIDNLICAGPFL